MLFSQILVPVKVRVNIKVSFYEFFIYPSPYSHTNRQMPVCRDFAGYLPSLHTHPDTHPQAHHEAHHHTPSSQKCNASSELPNPDVGEWSGECQGEYLGEYLISSFPLYMGLSAWLGEYGEGIRQN